MSCHPINPYGFNSDSDDIDKEAEVIFIDENEDEKSGSSGE